MPGSTRQLRVRRRYEYIECAAGVLSNQYVQMAQGCRTEWRIGQAWGTDKGIFFDIARNVTLYRGIKNFTPLTDEQKATVAAMPAAYREMLTAANDELLAQLEANKKKRRKDEGITRTFIARFSANASKSKQATSRKKALDKIQLDELKPSSRKYPIYQLQAKPRNRK